MNDHAREVRYALTDAMKLCTALNLAKGAERQASGLLICCPSHGDRTPSCSVTIAPDGTIRVKCFACDFSADALGLIAAVRGLNVRDAGDFREVLAEGAEIAGLLQLEAEIRDGKPRPDRPRVEAPERRPDAPYPDAGEVADMWQRGTHPAEDVEASRYLVGRKLDPVVIGDRQLARVIADPLPEWARYGSRSWVETGHRLVVRAWDSDGKARGVRAIQVRTTEAPKRLPPKGRKAAGLALLNRPAWEMVRGARAWTVIIVEGEPDFLQWGSMVADTPVIGLVSGSWSEAWAATIPRECTVTIRTHNDDAGDRYAKQVTDTLIGKDCIVRRKEPMAA